MYPEFPRQIFEKSLNIKLHENPSSRSWVVPYEHTDKKKLTVAFRNCANATNWRKQVPSSKPEDAAAVLTVCMQ